LKQQVDFTKFNDGTTATREEVIQTWGGDVWEDEWYVVAYWSRALNLTSKEAEWSASMAEAMGLAESIEHFRPYLMNGIPFIVEIDHEALVYLKTAAENSHNAKLLRIITDLQQYEFKLQYRKGKDHVQPDAMSRILTFDNQEDTEELEPEKAFGPVKEESLDDIMNQLDLLHNSKQRIQMMYEQTRQRNIVYLEAKKREIVL